MGDREDKLIRHGKAFYTSLTTLMTLTLVCVGFPSRAQITATKIDAKISNPGFIVADNTLSGVLLQPDDSQTALVETSFNGPILRAESTAVSMLSNSAFGITGLWDGESALGSGSFRNARSGGQLDIHDEIDVNSSVLSEGTPVVVTFSFYAEHAHTFFHTNGTVNTNNAGVDYKFSGTLVNLPSFLNTTSISNVDHRFRTDLGQLATPIATGMMDPAASGVDISIDTFVGETIDLQLRLAVLVSGSVVSTGVGQSEVHLGMGTGGVGIAFGANAMTPDVELYSQLLFDAPFPSRSEANLMNAESILSVPEPEAPIAIVAALLALLALAVLQKSGGRRIEGLSL